MTLHINKPNDDKRSNSKPLSLEEQNEAVEVLNNLIKFKKHYGAGMPPEKYELIQNLLNHYENLQALSDFIGGWEGAHRLVKPVDGDCEDVIYNTNKDE